MPKRSPAAVDERLRALLHTAGWSWDAPPPELFALGSAGLDRLLDAGSTFFTVDMDYRDYGNMVQQAVGAWAKHDLPAVLAAMRKRKWNDEAIAQSGAGLARDERIVPFLVRACAAREPLVRKDAVDCLGGQEHPRATAAVVEALNDRSSDVRLAAIRALARIADPATEEALHDASERYKSTPLTKQEFAAALAAVRRAARRRS